MEPPPETVKEPHAQAPADPGARLLLTLAFPAALEETIVGHLLEHPEWASGFTLVRAEGHGRAVALRDSAERVRGRAARLLAHIVLAPGEADRLLRHFGGALGAAEVFFWRTPIVDCGWLSDYAAQDSHLPETPTWTTDSAA